MWHLPQNNHGYTIPYIAHADSSVCFHVQGCSSAAWVAVISCQKTADGAHMTRNHVLIHSARLTKIQMKRLMNTYSSSSYERESRNESALLGMTHSIIYHFRLITGNLAMSCVHLFISCSFSSHKAIASVLCGAGGQRPSPLLNNIKITHRETQIEAITYQETHRRSLFSCC